MDSLSASHRQFLQHCIAKKWFTQSYLTQLYRLIKDLDTGESSPEPLDNFVSKINKSLLPIGFQLRRGIDENTGESIWGIVNIIEDDISQICTTYTPAEIQFLRQIIDKIVLAKQLKFCISMDTAYKLSLNAASASQSTNSQTLSRSLLTRSEREEVLDKFILDGQLALTSIGKICLGPRVLLELAPKLIEEYPNQIQKCYFCALIVTQGLKCNHAECDSSCHLACYHKLLKSMNEQATRYKQGAGVHQSSALSKKCPCCNLNWNPIEMGFIHHDNDESNLDQPELEADNVVNDDEEEENEDEEQEQGDISRSSVKRRRTRDITPVITQESDIDDANLHFIAQPSISTRLRNSPNLTFTPTPVLP